METERESGQKSRERKSDGKIGREHIGSKERKQARKERAKV